MPRQKLDYTVIEPTEAQIQAAIFDYLRSRGYFCWRNNTGGQVWQDKLGKDRYFRFGFVGSGDILGMTLQGKFFSVEVKRKNKKPTPDQELFMQRVRSSNGIAFVARGVDDVIANGL